MQSNQTQPPNTKPPNHQARDAQLRSTGGNTPKCHFFNTFFLTKLLNLEAGPGVQGTYDYKSVRACVCVCCLWLGVAPCCG